MSAWLVSPVNAMHNSTHTYYSRQNGSTYQSNASEIPYMILQFFLKTVIDILSFMIFPRNIPQQLGLQIATWLTLTFRWNIYNVKGVNVLTYLSSLKGYSEILWSEHTSLHTFWFYCIFRKNSPILTSLP